MGIKEMKEQILEIMENLFFILKRDYLETDISHGRLFIINCRYKINDILDAIEKLTGK